ncbi:7319_t:CDS:1, partial [Gigaspora rosea]
PFFTKCYGIKIAPDIAIYPNTTYVPCPNSGPTYFGPPPSDLQ